VVRRQSASSAQARQRRCTSDNYGQGYTLRDAERDRMDIGVRRRGVSPAEDLHCYGLWNTGQHN